MFEALVTLCALAGGGGAAPACRQVLLPGYAAETRAACEAALLAAPPGLLAAPGAGPAACAPRPAAALAFTEIAPGVFAHRGAVAEPEPGNVGDVANVGFVIGAKGIAVIDAGGSRQVGEQVYLAVRAVSELPITHLVLTHMHPDHVFGAEALREAGAEVLGHANLPRALSDRAESYQTSFSRLIGAAGFLGSRIIGPDRVLTGPETIDLGGRELRLTPWPVAHTASDLTVLDSATGTLFAGDLVFDVHVPALDGSLRGWLAVLAQLELLPATQVIPGHGGPVLPWPEGAASMRRYLGALEADTKAALAAGMALGPATAVIGQGEAGRWRLFELFNARNATVAYTEMEWD
ncbi:quinoprotein relay system zinc metallohydrolase 2 [Paracoccaceae bacterium Fryx2]|nr:quinoprotein relay system zinc metallohydrolase 2 [Paracoccaceae bacterium Fryx2]